MKIEDLSLLERSSNEELRTQAYRRLAGRPGQRIRLTYVRGLNEPLETEIVCDGTAAHWAQKVLAIVDADSWRTRFRRAVLDTDLPQLHELRTGEDANSQPPFNLIQLAGTLFLLERTNECLRFLELAQQQLPQNFWVNHYLGAALATAHEPQRPDLGLRYLTAAVALRPDRPGARVNLSETLLKLGHEQEAIAHFETAKKLSPSHVPVALRLKGLLERASVSSNLDEKLQSTNDPTEPHSIQLPDAQIVSQPINLEAFEEIEQQARLLANQSRRREALDLVRRAEEFHQAKTNSPSTMGPSDETALKAAMLRRVKGAVLLELQDFVAARVVLGDAARLNPSDAATRFYYGVALEQFGDSESAIHEYEAALKIFSDYEAVREFLRNLKQP